MPVAVERTDKEVQQEVLRELRWDSRVDETEVGVEVDRGVVTLTGTVSSYAKKVAAREAAHRVVGVLDVADDIQVKSQPALRRGHPGRPAKLRESIEEAIERRAEREAGRIRVRIEDGSVILEGRVRTWPEKQAILGTVSHAPGVKDVRDRLTDNPWD